MGVNTEQYLPMSKVKERGWTDAMITRFLGDPGRLAPNPRYRSAPPMKLYTMERVVQAEASPEFRQAQDDSKSRRAATQKAHATKKRKLDDYVANVEITVPQLTTDELIRRACSHYNSFGREDRADEHSDQDFLDRICVNYLRHELTEYETHLRKIAGKVGAHDAYLNLKARVLQAIGDAYEGLWLECDRQEQKMWDDDMERL